MKGFRNLLIAMTATFITTSSSAPIAKRETTCADGIPAPQAYALAKAVGYSSFAAGQAVVPTVGDSGSYDLQAAWLDDNAPGVTNSNYTLVITGTPGETVTMAEIASLLLAQVTECCGDALSWDCEVGGDMDAPSGAVLTLASA